MNDAPDHSRASSPECQLPADLRRRVLDGSVVELIERKLAQSAEEPLAQAVVEVLSEDGVSFLAFLSTPTFSSVEGFRFWDVQRFVSAIIPRLDNIDPVEMTRSVEQLVRQGGRDGAAGLPFDALKDWFQANPVRAESVIAAVQRGEGDLSPASVANAILALDDMKRTLTLMEAESTREAAIRAAAQLPHATGEQRGNLVKALRGALGESAGDDLKGLALDALVRVYNSAGQVLDTDALSLAEDLLGGAGDVTLNQAASLPFAYRAAMSEPLVNALLAALQSVNIEHAGTLDFLDTSLAVLTEDVAFAPAAVAFATVMVSRPQSRLTLGQLSGWFRAVLEGPAHRLHALLVDWLLHGSVELCHELSNSLPFDDLSGMPLDIDFPALGLSESERLVVCMRAIGWFFLHPVTAVSLAVSVLRSASPELAHDVAELIYDPLLLSYGGSAYDHLSKLPEHDAAHAFVAALVARADRYVADLRSTGVLPELHPSEHERFLERTRSADEMTKAWKAAEQKSVFLNIFPKALLLYGRTAVVSIRTADGQDHHQEIAMQSMSAHHELPRREISDPLGLDYQLRRLRAARVKR